MEELWGEIMIEGVKGSPWRKEEEISSFEQLIRGVQMKLVIILTAVGGVDSCYHVTAHNQNYQLVNR